MDDFFNELNDFVTSTEIDAHCFYTSLYEHEIDKHYLEFFEMELYDLIDSLGGIRAAIRLYNSYLHERKKDGE